jgi:hypothetical protein
MNQAAARTERRRASHAQLDLDYERARERHQAAEHAARKALDAWSSEKDPRQQMGRWNAYKRWEERQETAWREMQRIWREKDKSWAKTAASGRRI